MKRYVIERELPGIGGMTPGQLKDAAATSNDAPSTARSGPMPASSSNSASTSCSVPFATRESCMRLEKTIGQPCAGNPHARLERGLLEPGLKGRRA